MKSKLKVLYLTNIPSPYRVSFFNELGKYCDLTVLFERKSATDRNSEWPSHEFKNFVGIFLKGIRVTDDTAISLEIIKYLKINRNDIIVIGGYSTPTGIIANLYLSLINKKFVINIDGGFVDHKENKMKYNIKHFFISKASYWLSTGEIGNRYLNYYGAKRDKIFLYPFTSIYNKEIEKEIPSITEKKIIKKDLNITEDKIVIAVGSFVERKGFDILLKAANQIGKDVGVYLIGGLPTDEYLDIIKEKNLRNVHFVDFQKPDILKKYYLASDVFVLPTREDIWGLVINEAMANALPIITTNKCIAGIELIENNKNGFLVNVDDVNVLAEKIKIILNNDELRQKMSGNNIREIKDYTIEKMAKSSYEIFKKIKTLD